MSSKRKSTALGLERRVRARREEDWEPELSASDDNSEEEVSEEGDDSGDEDEEDSGEAESGSESEGADEDEPKVDFSSISFGALARAAASLPPSEKKRNKANADADGAPEQLTAKESLKREPRKASSSRVDPAKRSSKHAPQEMTSKKPVSRRREILADPRRKARDPRFEALTGKLDEAKIAKNYSFLDEYRENEMAELRMQIKKTKDATVKEELKRQLLSMESKKKARQKKEDEAKLLQEHRKKEKELVAQGKQPFYLRKSEQKKQLLMNRYASMSKSQVDKAIERKRKKVVSKEKKELASLERVSRRH
ncbi:pre-rrna processing [Trichoderma arundinaceum]|uniref:rRNA biogenesis protein RRP36 n=1 Tax=Trichoderma arundinaceum TaxID=490622 RepID=A0A395NUY9_TRIAR|nr:pre-rrna processing [Trichoderma arundinaceum]